jgi:hypothetical protein
MAAAVQDCIERLAAILAAEIRRREFVALLGGAMTLPIAWPAGLHAQQMRSVGVLMSYAESVPVAQTMVTAVRDGLAKLGWIEGKNVRVEFRVGCGECRGIQDARQGAGRPAARCDPLPGHGRHRLFYPRDGRGSRCIRERG